MKITFVLHTINISGGVKAVFEFANNLILRGHRVSVVYPVVSFGKGTKWYNPRKVANELINTLKNFKQSAPVAWIKVKADLLRVPTLTERYIPDADIVVATWWETAYSVSRLSKSKGEKFYLIQHYEIWGGAKQEVDRTFKLGLHNVVNSTWLKNILEKELDSHVDRLILHAPDRQQFYPEQVERKDDSLRVLLPYRVEEWKGMQDGVKAFELAREKHPGIRLVMFGPIRGRDVPDYAEFHNQPSNDELRRLYNSSDIFLFPSHEEGFGMPPMEAMACKLAVAATSVGAVLEYSLPGETALVTPPRAPELLAESLIKLIEDAGLRRKIALAGYEYIQKFTWAGAAEELEKAFFSALGPG